MKNIEWSNVFVKAVLIIVTVVLLSVSMKYCLIGHVVEIDGCEYIRSGYALTHKGNCKYCEERKEK